MACQYNALISYRLHSFSCLRCCLKTQASIKTQLPIHDAEMIYDFGVSTALSSPHAESKGAPQGAQHAKQACFRLC